MTPVTAKEFDLLTGALEGSNLIEASAGTGKTFAIAGIVLRLLVEKELKIEDILVVTYTIAATEELRDRIRSMIRQTIRGFASGYAEDQFLNHFIRRCTDPARSERLLRAALRNFDGAAIHTIHSFCQRTLRDKAFESMSPFETNFITDERPLREEIVQDFWRRTFYEAPLEVVAYTLEKKLDIKAMVKLVQSTGPLEAIRFVPDTPSISIPPLHALREAYSSMSAAWEKDRNEVLQTLQLPALSRTTYRHPEDLVRKMDRYVQSGRAVPVSPVLNRFTASCVRSATKKGAVSPEHSFFCLCEDLMTAGDEFADRMDAYLLYLKAELFRYVRRELPRRKERQLVQSFDDLLSNLHRALEAPVNEPLVQGLRGRYRAALIDEFQDTDPIQYAIFRRIFHHGEHILFLIGDPKQAIYSFRGADLFAYMDAHEEAGNRYTLTRNWRSSPDLIHAVNTIFSGRKDPFVYRRIAFEPVAAGPTETLKALTFSGCEEPPFQLCLLEKDRLEERGVSDSKEGTRQMIAAWVAAEALRLIRLGRDKKALIGEVGLTAGDLAILVRDRYEARIMQKALRDLAVPSVLHSAGNVFDSPEARDLLRLMAAIAEPAQEGLLRAALATTLLGIKGEELAACQENDPSWEQWIFRFRQYRQLWELRGFIAMFRSFLSGEKVRERLLAFPDGERQLTNFLHLAEILHLEEMEQKAGMTGMVTWLNRQQDPDAARVEEHELRLENDDEAVRIVTVHKSKGLEYPVVFCPFTWGGSGVDKSLFTYHKQVASGGWQRYLALDGTSNPHLPDAEEEALAENARLLYVALTRARYRCYLFWGRFKDSETSAPAYILHPREAAAGPVLADLNRHIRQMTDDAFRHDVDLLTIRSGGAITISTAPPVPGERLTSAFPAEEDLRCRHFSAAIERNERIASFSYLIGNRLLSPGMQPDELADSPDHDGMSQTGFAPDAVPPESIFAFPRGARAGTLLHEILEVIDFRSADRNSRETLVKAKLKEHAFEDIWLDTICAMLEKVCHVPLFPGRKDFTLAKIASGERISELEFYFPLKNVTPDTLSALFSEGEAGGAASFSGQTGRLQFQPARGFLKGFMDLVFRYESRFYLVDWKSNFLGNRIEDYAQTGLRDVMEDEYYTLQYHLYVLALHRYLRTRLPDYDYDRHFGGVFYLFLRGMDPARGPAYGVFHDRPGKQRIESLEKGLIG